MPDLLLPQTMLQLPTAAVATLITTLGAVLAFSFFAAATYKAYGPKALRMAMALIMVFGVAGGSLTPLVLKQLIRGSLNTVVPVQTLFALPAFALYFWLRHRYGPERTMTQFRAALDAEQAEKARRRAPASPSGELGRPAAVPAGRLAD